MIVSTFNAIVAPMCSVNVGKLSTNSTMRNSQDYIKISSSYYHIFIATSYKQDKKWSYLKLISSIYYKIHSGNETSLHVFCFLAHLSRRLMGELIGYPCLYERRRTYVRRRRSQFQTFSPKQLARSKPNFMWSLLGYGERKLVRGIWVT